MTDDQINLPDVLAEVRQVFQRYETALVSNDVEALNELFWKSPHTVRFGIAECLYGHDQISAFRAARSPLNLARALRNTVITTYGLDMATASTEFQRPTTQKTGRQMQTWLRLPQGWRVVAAHVSLID